MQFTTQRYEYLWERYLNASISNEELKELWEELKTATNLPEKEVQIELVEASLKEGWENPVVDDSLTVRPDWEQVWQEIDQSATPIVWFRKVYIKPISIGIAASLLLLLGYQWISSNGSFNKSVQKAKEPVLVRVKQPTNQIVLEDGSTITLSPTAKILSQQFDAKHRIVRMEGEAFFDVTHDSKRPFLVYANNVQVRVLGTAFFVSALPGKKVAVTVTRGRVEVSNASKVVAVLTPAQAVNIDLVTGITALNTKVDTTSILPITGWDEWKWNDATLNEVVSWMNQHFKVQITLREIKSSEQLFTVGFPITTSLEEMLEIITKVYRLSYKKTGETTYELYVGDSFEN